MCENELLHVQTSAVEQPPMAKQTKHTVEGGVIVEDVKEGHGPEAKSGKLVSRFHSCIYCILLHSIIYTVFHD